jgi:hypothetical protein
MHDQSGILSGLSSCFTPRVVGSTPASNVKAATCLTRRKSVEGFEQDSANAPHPTHGVASHRQAKRPEAPADSAIVGLVTVGFILVLAVGFGMEMYESADEAGWFPRDRSVSVWIPHGWIVGEFKECVSSSDVKTLALLSSLSKCGTDGPNRGKKGRTNRFDPPPSLMCRCLLWWW